MKKLLFKASLLVGVMLMVPYYLLGGGTLPGFLQGMFNSGKEAVAPMFNVSNVTTDQEVTLYKCVDERGQVEFSQSHCLGDGETIHLKPNVNVVPRSQSQEQESVAEASGGRIISLGTGGEKAGDSNKNESGLELGNPYNPDNIQKLVKDAKNINQLMEQRGNQVDNADVSPH